MEYKLTIKENFLRLMSGEMPEYIPKFEMDGWMLASSVKIGNGYTKEDGTRVDHYGVEYTSVPTAPGQAAMPTPGKIILADIEDWEKVIHTPEIPTDVDWEAVAKKDLEKIDRVNRPVMMEAGAYFQPLMGFMSFTEGLCAMYENPEAVYDLFSYLSEYHLKLEKILLHYYKPDIWYLLDDNATKLNPFISPEMNRQLVIPFQKKQAELALDAGCRVLMHDCGRCEDFIDDWLEIGISGFDPAQIQNDLLGIKAKYGRRMALIGGWDYQGPPSWPTTPDEEMMEAAKNYVDTLAPGGGFAWEAGCIGSVDDMECKRKDAMLQQFYEDYAKPWYKLHGG